VLIVEIASFWCFDAICWASGWVPSCWNSHASNSEGNVGIDRNPLKIGWINKSQSY